MAGADTVRGAAQHRHLLHVRADARRHQGRVQLQRLARRLDDSTFSGLLPIERSDQADKFVVEKFHPSGGAASKY